MKPQASLSIRLEARGGCPDCGANAGLLTLRERLQRERREQRRPSWQDLLVEGELGRVQPWDIFPDAEPDKGPRHLLKEVREVLGAHRRVGQLQNRVLAEELLRHAQGTAGRAFIVGGDRVRENVVQIRVAAHPLATPRATASIRPGILSRRSGFRVLTVPPRRAFSGMMLKAVPAPISPTVRTTGSTGSTSRDTTVCNTVTTCAAMTTASAARWGIAPCPPEPVISISKASAAAIMGPAFVATFPNGNPGHRCSAKMEETSSATPSSTMTLPPPPPSSAGWNTN